jgi:hypothetical protein
MITRTYCDGCEENCHPDDLRSCDICNELYCDDCIDNEITDELATVCILCGENGMEETD